MNVESESGEISGMGLGAFNEIGIFKGIGYGIKR
jgi:hypothetical protein